MKTKPLSITEMQQLLIQIPQGKVVTYAEMARAMGRPKAARAIGNLLNKNPDPNTFPCCKVIKSTGEIGGFALGNEDKIERLQKEGVEIENGKVVDLQKHIYRFQ
jgi:O-6-methylguanine DNA methyltransferase